MSYIDLPIKGSINQFRRFRATENYEASSSDNYIGCDANSGSITITLPPASSVIDGKCVVIKDEGGSSSDPLKRVFIVPAESNKIDGSFLTLDLTSDYESITLVCNGVDEWFII